MSKLRSVQITLINNTPFTLTHFWEFICHGSWANVTGNPTPTPAQNASLPETVAPFGWIQWQSQDVDLSVGTGTEAWVKYTCPQTTDPTNPISELVWIHWDNPFAWDGKTNPIDYQVSLSDVIPTCGSGDSWPPFGVVPGSTRVTELFGVSKSGTEPPAAPIWQDTSDGPPFDELSTAWNAVFGWPVLLVQGLIDVESDINLTFTLGLRRRGSIGDSIRRFYDGSKGLRALALKAQQPSLKKLFGM
jgi:hypothetical protein